jgi:hypothetical protein
MAALNAYISRNIVQDDQASADLIVFTYPSGAQPAGLAAIAALAVHDLLLVDLVDGDHDHTVTRI